jgi:hypothetical protein
LAPEEGAVLRMTKFITVAGGEILRRRRSARVHDRRTVSAAALAGSRPNRRKLAVEIELLLGPARRTKSSHWWRFVAVVVRSHMGAERGELVLEPAADDVHGEVRR